MVDGGGLMIDGGRGMICIAFQAKCGVMGISYPEPPGLHPAPRDFIPGYLRSAIWRLPDSPVKPPTKFKAKLRCSE